MGVVGCSFGAIGFGLVDLATFVLGLFVLISLTRFTVCFLCSLGCGIVVFSFTVVLIVLWLLRFGCYYLFVI